MSINKPVIAIINYGMGNLQSVSNVLDYYGCCYEIINFDSFDSEKSFDGYIIPGVGSFKKAVNTIVSSGLKKYLIHEVTKCQKPLLGICLGMQLLFESSEEDGFSSGLSFIDGQVIKFNSSIKKIPHVGWNNIEFKSSKLLDGILNNSDMYFDHSFYVNCEKQYIIAETDYFGKFAAAVCKNNVFGVQFHPEKSQTYGSKIIKNFIEICSKN